MGRSFVSRSSSTISRTEEEIMANWSAEEMKSLPPRYGCEILVEAGTPEQIKGIQYPNDAYIITYQVDGKNYQDLCRGRRVGIFDLYYDKFGPGTVLNIDFGYGKISPKVWGYKSPEKKKKK